VEREGSGDKGNSISFNVIDHLRGGMQEMQGVCIYRKLYTYFGQLGAPDIVFVIVGTDLRDTVTKSLPKSIVSYIARI